jgi:dolichyl-phosphate-mannose--protein O-mannosyl transferase
MKPMGYYKYIDNELLSSLSSFGNPAIFWLGIVAIFYLFIRVFRAKNLEAFFLLSAFFSLYLPYAFVGRLMFIYHFYYALPFLILAIVLMWRDAIERFAFMRTVLWVYLIIVVSLFLAFYPILSAYAIDHTYVSSYLKWFDSWWF